MTFISGHVHDIIYGGLITRIFVYSIVIFITSLKKTWPSGKK